MRRPWELAHMQENWRGGPRVYVPFRPDTSTATFAVLELVGFSSSPSSSQSSLSPSLQPATLCHSQLHPPPIQSSITSHTENYPTCLQIAPAANADTTSSVSLPIADAAPSSSPPIAKKPGFLDGRVHVVQTHIKENVVHTTSLNFKDVVQQLTGASSNVKDIMPSTVRPNELAAMPTPGGGKAVANKILDALSAKVDASKGFKKVPSKLQERRKDIRNLEKLCTDKRLALLATSTSPLSPSPVTPLASYFEKFCTAITPTASQSSGRSSGVSSPEVSLILESDSPNTPVIVPYTGSIAEHCTSGGGAHALSKHQQYASVMETLRSPALLSLFPESPM